MNKIFLVLKNLKHNGEALPIGSLFEGALETFSSLVDQGVLKVIEGAESLAHAAKIVEADVKAAAQQAETQAAAAPKDVWNPQPNATETAQEPAKPTETTETEQKPEGDAQKPAETQPEAPAAGTVGAGDVAPESKDQGNDL